MLVVDIETTGRDPSKHSIASIGALELISAGDHFEIGREFYQECRIWKKAEVVSTALEVNGFTESQLRDPSKPSLQRTIRHFITYAQSCQDQIFAGSNMGSFDALFLQASAQRYEIVWPFGNSGYRTVELHTSGVEHHLRRGLPIPLKEGLSALSTDAIFEYVGLLPEPKPHHALTGAKMEAEAFSRLIYGKNVLPEYAGVDVTGFLGTR